MTQFASLQSAVPTARSLAGARHGLFALTVFLALAAGSILYVIVQLLKVAQRMSQPEVLMWGLVIGLALGFATDYVLVAAGA